MQVLVKSKTPIPTAELRHLERVSTQFDMRFVSYQECIRQNGKEDRPGSMYCALLVRKKDFDKDVRNGQTEFDRWFGMAISTVADWEVVVLSDVEF
jgi:hypothetical protein